MPGPSIETFKVLTLPGLTRRVPITMIQLPDGTEIRIVGVWPWPEAGRPSIKLRESSHELAQ